MKLKPRRGVGQGRGVGKSRPASGYMCYLVAIFAKNGQRREVEIEAHSAEQAERDAYCALSEQEQWDLESMEVSQCRTP